VVREFTDLVAWQLCHELKCEVFEFTSHDPALRDFRFRDDIRTSSASSPANISEGFKRYRPAEFARFLEFALGSLGETANHLIHAHDRKDLDARLSSRLANLARAATRATTNLLLAKRRQVEQERCRRSPRARAGPRRKRPG
jgi:four helix bundle protein